MATGMLTRDELRKLGKHGFSEEDYAEFLRRSIARREDIQAHEMDLNRMIQEYETGRTGMREAGLAERLGKELEFQKPEQTARIGEIGARTEESRYGLKFKKGLEPELMDIVRQKKTAGQLEEDILREQLKEYTTPKKGVTPEVATPTIPAPTVARPTARRRTMRPSARRFLWEGTPTKTGLNLPGLLAPVYGYYNLAQWLGYGAKKGATSLYDYLYPRNR